MAKPCASSDTKGSYMVDSVPIEYGLVRVISLEADEKIFVG